jgi:hypothetical protein
VDEDEAVAIAREEVDFRPERVVVRFVPRGVESLPFWAVSLSSLSPSGTREECATVLVDGRTGEVAETRAC